MRRADERRGEYFRAGLRTRAAVYWMVILASAGFIVGAWQRDLLLLVTLPAAAVLMVAGAAYYFATRRAENEFFRHFADTRGLEHWPRYTVLPYTPLLAAGDRQRFEHWIGGGLSAEPPLTGGFGRFVYECVESSREGETVSASERGRLTVGVIDLPLSMQRYRGVFLRPRRGVFELGYDWLGKTRSRTIELESTRFSERYELRIAADQDEIEARRLFAPSLINWLAEHPFALGLELKAGVLVVFVDRVLEDDGSLTYFLDALRHVGARVLAEAGETARL